MNYDNIDEKLCEMHIWIKMLKYGFWRPTDQSCYHIWNRRMTREEGVENVLAKQYQFPYEYLTDFLDYHMLKEGEFFDELEKWRNKDIWIKRNKQSCINGIAMCTKKESWRIFFQIFYLILQK